MKIETNSYKEFEKRKIFKKYKYKVKTSEGIIQNNTQINK